MAQKSERIVRYTMAELNEKVEREGTLSDWEAFDAMTEEELEASIDYEEEGLPIWESARKGRGLPQPQQEVTMLVDRNPSSWNDQYLSVQELLAG